MIATTSSGRRFAALARYLLHGRSGHDPERVAWTAGRNLGLDDPELAAVLMQATADENPRVDVPVYHLTINFDPKDPVTRSGMQAVADRVLGDLGLAEHQALMVAHQDRAHPHVHVMVNRVHPDTGVAWERWQDHPRIERTLRELERELGLREVAGRLYQLEGQKPPEPALLTNGERRQAVRTGEPALPDRVRAHLPELRAARSWAELEQTLAAHGLRLERKGQGLVITDGQHQVKASRVARDLSLRRLEERFGVPFPGREEELAQREPSRDVAQLQSAIEDVERITALERSRTGAEQELQGIRRRQGTLDHALEGFRRADERFLRALERVYTDPALARALLDTAVEEIGAERVGTLLETKPERFGALRTVEQARAFGLLIAQDDTQARRAAPAAAVAWRQFAEREGTLLTVAHAELPKEAQERAVAWAEQAREHLATLAKEMQTRLEELKQELHQLPSRHLLERSVTRVIGRLEPRELKQLRLVLTHPQRALLFKARQVIRDIALGRGEEDEFE